MNLDALVAPLRADVVSGASAIARTAANVLRRGAERAEVERAQELRDLLADLTVRILDAQPAMAPLFHLGARVLRAACRADDLPGARRHAVNAAARFRADMEGAADRVAEHAVPLLPDDGRIVTLSASSTVAAVLGAAARAGHRLQVVCLESRPMSEGRNLARTLTGHGIDVVYAVDAAAWALTEDADAVILGADSVGDRGVVNKIGSRSLAAAARHGGIPTYVLTDRTKFLPPGFPQPVDDDRPGDEVWKSPSGIGIWNRYFERVAVERVERIVVEDGTISPGDVARAREGLAVPDPLRRWADARP